MKVVEKEEFFNVEENQFKVKIYEATYQNIKFSININQLELIKLGVDIDIVDACIIDYMLDFIACLNKNIKTKVVDNQIYKWIAYQKIIDDMPLLKISNKEVLSRRINKLCKLGFFKVIIDRKDNNKTYFAVGDMSENVKFNNFYDSSRLKSREVTDSKVVSLPTQKSDNTIINDTNIKDTINCSFSQSENSQDIQDDFPKDISLEINKITNSILDENYKKSKSALLKNLFRIYYFLAFNIKYKNSDNKIDFRNLNIYLKNFGTNKSLLGLKYLFDNWNYFKTLEKGIKFPNINFLVKYQDQIIPLAIKEVESRKKVVGEW